MNREERRVVEALLSAVDTLRYHYQSEHRPIAYANDVFAAQRVVRALLDAPESEAPRGEWTCRVYVMELEGGALVVRCDDRVGASDFAHCPTREDAERVAEMLREVGRRLRP